MAFSWVSKKKWLWQELPWMALLSHHNRRRIVATVDGGWLMTIAMRGPDLGTRSPADRFSYSSLLNHTIRQLGSGYVAWADEMRVPWPHYQRTQDWENQASEIYDAEAEAAFKAGGHFVSRTWLTIYFKPPSEAQQRVVKELIAYDPEEDNDPYSQRLDAFVAVVERIAGSLSSWMPYVEILENGRLLTYLKTHISTKLHNVADMEHDEQLPGSLVDMPFEGGWRPKMGHSHDRWSIYPISIHNYATSSVEAAVLSKLRALPYPVRWRRCVRWIAQDKHESISDLGKAWAKAAAARKPVGAQFLQAATGEQSLRINPAADQALLEAESAHVEMERGLVSRGYLTQTLIVYVPRKPAIQKAVKAILGSLRTDNIRTSPLLEAGLNNAVERLGLAAPFEMEAPRAFERVLNDEGLVAQIATLNAAQTIKGAIPGAVYDDVTRHGVNSAVATGFMPYDGVWQGVPQNPHLGGQCLIQARTNGSEPFYLNTHPRRNAPGNVMLFGRSRGGKTALKNAMLLNHMKYPGAQIFGIELNRGSMVTTLCMGGSYHELGGAHGRPLQPLRMISTSKWWRQRMHDWLMAHCVSVNAELASDPELSKELTLALDRAAAVIPDDDRNMTAFVAGLNHLWGKQALRSLTRDGEYGDIFDGIDRQSYDNRVVMFDITDAAQTTSVPLLVTYLFLLMLSRAHPDRPMMFAGDEAVNLMRPPFSSIMEVHFLRLASQNIQAVLATQQVTDAILSPISSALTSNCSTRIFTPGPDVRRRGPPEKPAEGDALSALGLRDSEIEALASASGYQYLLQQEIEDSREGSGVRFFDLNLSSKQLALVGSTDSKAVERARRILRTCGSVNFLGDWMADCGFSDVGLPTTRFTTAAE
jgi:type IV secretory pathway VirB4 component